MKLGILIIYSVLFSVNAYSESLDESIEYGKLLAESVKSKKEIKLNKLAEYKEIKAFLKENKCSGFKYRAYIVGEDSSQKIYLIASKGKNVVLGRHFSAPYTNKKVDMSGMESSTNGCLDLGPVKDGVAGMFATHLKPIPNEFHVLESSINNITLYVGTKEGMYIVKNEEITLSEKE